MKKIIPFALVGATLVLAGCMSTSISSADADKLTAEITANSFSKAKASPRSNAYNKTKPTACAVRRTLRVSR